MSRVSGDQGVVLAAAGLGFVLCIFMCLTRAQAQRSVSSSKI
jgi:hypothetical protein